MAKIDKDKTLAKVGVWAFMVGMVLALVAGFLPNDFDKFTIGVLVLVGVIVGFLNVTEEETKDFLLASVAMLIALFTAQGAAANFTTLGAVGDYFLSVLASVNVFIFPATVVVGMKAIYNLAKDA